MSAGGPTVEARAFGARPLALAPRLWLSVESGDLYELACEEVTQRNWSRIARARSADGAPLFLKQFHDRRGNWHEEHWRYEREGTEVARAAFDDAMLVPAVLASSRESLVLVYEHAELEPVDEHLRADPTAFEARFPRLVEELRRMLETLSQGPPPGSPDLRVKERPYGAGSDALCFKGLDVRNVALGADGRLAVFDLGRPYRAPIEEAAAKILVSIGLLNWGRPMRRFRRGPDAARWQRAAEHLRPFLDRAAVRAEIELQRAVRTQTFQGRFLESTLKRWGVQLVGHRYLEALVRLAEELPR